MRALLTALLRHFLTPPGLVVLGALDSSLIFFLPLGIDFAVIILSARTPESVLAACAHGDSRVGNRSRRDVLDRPEAGRAWIDSSHQPVAAAAGPGPGDNECRGQRRCPRHDSASLSIHGVCSHERGYRSQCVDLPGRRWRLPGSRGSASRPGLRPFTAGESSDGWSRRSLKS